MFPEPKLPKVTVNAPYGFKAGDIPLIEDFYARSVEAAFVSLPTISGKKVACSPATATTHELIAENAAKTAGYENYIIRTPTNRTFAYYTGCIGEIRDTDTSIDIVKRHANKPDCIDPNVHYLAQQWRHGYIHIAPLVIWGQAPAMCHNYAADACDEYFAGNDDLYFYNMSLACHYLADMGVPFHTTLSYQDKHIPFEQYAYSIRTALTPTMQTAPVIQIRNPFSAVIELAHYSNQRAYDLWLAMTHNRTSEVENITHDLIARTTGYVAGLFEWTPRHLKRIQIENVLIAMGLIAIIPIGICGVSKSTGVGFL